MECEWVERMRDSYILYREREVAIPHRSAIESMIGWDKYDEQEFRQKLEDLSGDASVLPENVQLHLRDANDAHLEENGERG